MTEHPTKESGNPALIYLNTQEAADEQRRVRQVEAERDALRVAGNAVVASGSDRTSMWVSVRVGPFDALVAALERPE